MPQTNPFENSEHAYSSTVTPVLHSKPGWSPWTGNPCNPTCGRISLETGAKVFLRVYMYFTILILIGFVSILVLAGFSATQQRQDSVKKVNQTKDVVSQRVNQTQDVVSEIAKYESQIVHGYVLVLFVVIGVLCLTAYSCYKCRKAMEQGTVAQMKTHFWVVLFFVAFDVIGTIFLEHDALFLVFFDFPKVVFSVFGILFVYNFILERIQVASASFAYSRNPTLEPV